MAKVVFENVYKSYPRRRAEDSSVLSDSSPAKIEGEKNAPAQKSGTHGVSVSVLRNINFTVEDGEFMVLVGPSGCGKSTLLRMLAGLEELTGGNIWVGDRLINNLPSKERDIAMVFQNYALYPHLNVYDNIAFGLRRSNQLSVNSHQKCAGRGVSETNESNQSTELKTIKNPPSTPAEVSSANGAFKHLK